MVGATPGPCRCSLNPHISLKLPGAQGKGQKVHIMSKNTKMIALKAAFDNVDETVYNKTVQWWTDDVMSTFGEYLMTLYSEGSTQSSREFYGKPKITAEIEEWFQGGSAADCMCCLELLESEADWDVEGENEEELSEYIISGIASDVATEVMKRLEKQLAGENI